MDYHIVGGGYLHVRTSFTGLLTVGRLAVTPGVAVLMEARSGHKRNLFQLVFVKSGLGGQINDPSLGRSTYLVVVLFRSFQQIPCLAPRPLKRLLS